MYGLSICSGIGALDDALRLLYPGYRPVVFVERESFAASVLVARMEAETLAPAPIWDLLETFDGRPYRGIVDCVTAGFPCQPWSAAGKRKGTGDERWIWHEVARVIAESEPRFVFLENVEGLCRRGGLAGVVADLAALRYDAAWDCFSAAGVGAPHRRRRLFVVARRVPDTISSGVRNKPERREGRAQAPESRDTESSNVGEKSLANTDGERIAQGSWYPQRKRSDAQSSSAEAMANTDGERLQSERLALQGGADQGAPRHQLDGCDSSLWPPPPNDLSAWRRVPMESQPAFCRLAHGAPPDRRQWLHAIGNSVVPLVAAHAFRNLSARLKNV